MFSIFQGVHATVTYGDIDNMDNNTTNDTFEQQFRTAVIDACINQGKRNNIINHRSTNDDIDNDNDDVNDIDDDDDEATAAQVLTSVLLASYDRTVLGQTGSGHFSPITAYDPVSDSVLIMDTARFKYGSHWVQLSLLANAMKPIDPDSGRSRGFIVLTNPIAQAIEMSAIISNSRSSSSSSGSAPIGTTTTTQIATQTTNLLSTSSLTELTTTYGTGRTTLPRLGGRASRDGHHPSPLSGQQDGRDFV
jgi:Phytochelatin synthase